MKPRTGYVLLAPTALLLCALTVWVFSPTGHKRRPHLHCVPYLMDGVRLCSNGHTQHWQGYWQDMGPVGRGGIDVPKR